MMIFYQRSNGRGDRSAIPSHHEQLADGAARLVRYLSGTRPPEKTTNRLRSCHGGSVTSIVTSLATIAAPRSLNPKEELSRRRGEQRSFFVVCKCATQVSDGPRVLCSCPDGSTVTNGP